MDPNQSFIANQKFKMLCVFYLFLYLLILQAFLKTSMGLLETLILFVTCVGMTMTFIAHGKKIYRIPDPWRIK